MKFEVGSGFIVIGRSNIVFDQFTSVCADTAGSWSANANLVGLAGCRKLFRKAGAETGKAIGPTGITDGEGAPKSDRALSAFSLSRSCC